MEKKTEEYKKTKYIYERDEMFVIQEALISVGCSKKEAAKIAWSRFKLEYLPTSDIIETHKTLVDLGLDKEEALSFIGSRI